MGRTLSINSVDAQTFQVLAGEQINENDLVQMGPDGKGYCTQGTNTAAVANCTYGTAQTNAATGMIVAQTQVVAVSTAAHYRQAVLRGDDGSVYTFTAQNNSASSGGLMLSKYSSSGALLAKIDIDISSTSTSAHQIFFLSNGSICVFANLGINSPRFALYDTNLTVIKSLSPIATTSSQYSSACALADGGFAVVFQPSENPLISQLATYDNAGNVVLPATTIWTRTGTSGAQYHRMAQLSDGTLAVTVSSANTVSSIGLFHGIVTTSGTSVLPFTNIDTATASILPELSVMDGYYSVARGNGTYQKAFVFNNAGVQQGGTFSIANTAFAATTTCLISDGSNFFMIWPRSSDSKAVLTKIPVTGTGYTTSDVTLGTPQYNAAVNAFCKGGLIVAVSQTGSTNVSPVLWVVDTTTSALLSKSGTSFGVVPGTSSGIYHRVIPGDDFSFICLYEYGAVASTNLYIGKYANTAIMGVAKTSGAAGQLVSVTGESGGHAINKLAGPASVAFDHSAATTIGNKGTLMNYGVTLKGI